MNECIYSICVLNKDETNEDHGLGRLPVWSDSKAGQLSNLTGTE